MNTTTPPDEKLARTDSESSKAEKRRSPDVEAHTIPVETHDIFDNDSGVDPVYQAKARILNDAFQEIGMGKYQVRVFNSWWLSWGTDT